MQANSLAAPCLRTAVPGEGLAQSSEGRGGASSRVSCSLAPGCPGRQVPPWNSLSAGRWELTAEWAWDAAEGGGEGAEASGLPGAGGVRRRAGLRSWAGPGEVSDPRARTALLGPVRAGPGQGARTGRGIWGQGWPGLRVGAQGLGFQASSREEFCLPSDSDE